jgi:hypothetical protein
MEVLRMKTSGNIADLKDSLETIRKEKFPSIPIELLDTILTIEYENQDNRSVAQSKTFKAIDDYMNTISIEKAGRNKR